MKSMIPLYTCSSEILLPTRQDKTYCWQSQPSIHASLPKKEVTTAKTPLPDSLDIFAKPKIDHDG